jgi:hypothetical protein
MQCGTPLLMLIQQFFSLHGPWLRFQQANCTLCFQTVRHVYSRVHIGAYTAVWAQHSVGLTPDMRHLVGSFACF